MKINGFREIDFSKIECKYCGINQIGILPYVAVPGVGMVYEIIYEKGWSSTPRFRQVECIKCKGVGFIDDYSDISILELE